MPPRTRGPDVPLRRRPPASAGGLASRLMRMAEALRSAADVDHSLQLVTRAAAEVTGSYQSTLRLLDEGGRRLLLSARSGPPMHRRGGGRFVPGEGFIGWVTTTGRAALTNEPGRDRHFVRRARQSWMPAALMAVPLLGSAGVIGVLSTARRSGAGFRQADLAALQLVAELSVPRLEMARLRRLSEIDPLTLLHNRRYVDERLPELFELASRARRPLVVAMMDIDRFKRVNDTWGHDVGDEVLVEVAERLRQACRRTDLRARWGGEEFLVVFPETRLRNALRVAERIRATVAAAPVRASTGSVAVSVSLGLARMEEADTLLALQRRADQALLRAKRAGRNRVVAG